MNDREQSIARIQDVFGEIQYPRELKKFLWMQNHNWERQIYPFLSGQVEYIEISQRADQQLVSYTQMKNQDRHLKIE